MSTPLLSKKALSKILRNQLDIYNNSHPTDTLNYDRLFYREKYFQQKHSIRYTCLSYAFNDKIEQTVLDRIDKSFDESFTRKQKKCLHDFDEINKGNSIDGSQKTNSKYISKEDFFALKYIEDPLDCADDNYTAYSDIELYMNGDYYFENEFPQSEMEHDVDNLIVFNPNALFYNLARILHADEALIMMAFYDGEGLDLNYYLKQYVKDVLDYYFEKSKPLTYTQLENKISRNGFKSSNIGNILDPDKEITFEQFATIAPFLNIPERLTTACKYRLAQYKNLFAYNAGYEAGCEDFYDASAERGLFKNTIYLYKLFKYIGFSFPDYSNIPENFSDIISYINTESPLSIITPNGTKSIISVGNYLNIVDKISRYAKELLEKECIDSNNTYQK